MREGRPSQTAAMVAFFRAMADDGATNVPRFRDPVARHLLPGGWRWLFATLSPTFRVLPGGLRRWLSQPMDFLPLRVMTIDAQLARAVAAGCRQLVILGAGLDARAYRLDALAGTTVYEVDFPATQAYKMRKVAGIPPKAAHLVYVPVDFERDSLAGKLAEAGHRAEASTVWIWEGVVMYLTDAALRGTLEAVAGCSAPGSTLILHYHEHGGPTGDNLPVRILLALWGEAQVGLRSREAVAADAQAVGLEVVTDLGSEAQAAEAGAPPSAAVQARASRILVARVPGAAAALG